MKTVLVSIHTARSPQAVPLANAFLLSHLKSVILSGMEIGVSLADYYLTDDVKENISALTATEPDAVGFSMYVWNRSRCVEMAMELRRTLPGVVIFAGGPEVTADPEGVMPENCFDFLITGEGEIPFSEAIIRLHNGQDLAGIAGVVMPDREQQDFRPGITVTELDSIPSPWLDGTLNAADYKGVLWQLSRGCGFSCDFCFDARGSSGVRRFSLERAKAELKQFVKAGVLQVFVLDSTFNQDAQRAKTILRMIRKTALQIHFHFEVRSEFIDREMAELFAGITCSLQIGLQSADPDVLKKIGRAFNRKDFEKRVALLNEAGAVFGFDLMYGLPGDTLAGFESSLNFALAQYPNHLDIFPLAILPGTALAARSSSIGLKHLASPPYSLICTPDFSEEEMAAAAALSNACDIFYTRGRSVAWFNMVVHALKMTPAGFLNRFSAWLEKACGRAIREDELSDREIWQMQRRFITVLFSQGKQKRLLPLVLDLVDYHYHYACVLMEAPHVPPLESELPDMLRYTPRLADSTRLAVFNYEILDLIESYESDLHRLAQTASASGSWAAIYPSPDGVRTESLIQPYYQMLEKMDGKTACGKIAASLGIPAEDTVEFMEFAILEGIII